MMSILKRGSLNWSFALRKALNWFLLSWAFLLVQRAVFLFAYFPARGSNSGSAAGGESAGTALLQFFLGLRFDLAVIPFLIGPILLLLPLFATYDKLPLFFRRLLRGVNFLQYGWFGLLNQILTASTFNFAFNNKHLGWEFYAYLADVGTILGGVVEERPLVMGAYFAALPLAFLTGWWIVYRRRENEYTRMENRLREEANAGAGSLRPDKKRPTRPGGFFRTGLEIALLFLFVLAFTVIASRGGIQENPIRSADAFRGTSSYLNSLPLNGIFTILQDRGEAGDFRRFYDPAANRAFTQNLLGKPGDFPLKDYPLLRWMPPREPFGKLPGDKPPNIVLVVLESFTAKFLRMHGGDPRIAPNLDKLMREGLYFRRFYASGGRSANGLFCMLAGLPDRAGRTILRSAQIQNRFGSAATLLGRKGYRTFFVHGGDLRFDNLNRVLPHLGFQELAGRRAMAATERYKNSISWGFHDGDTFDMFRRIMDKEPGRPFMGVVFTLNTHHPFAVPDKKYRVFGKETRMREYLNAYRYTDAALGRFMDSVRDKPYFKNTYFLFVADHTSHANLDYLEDRTIPFLIYAPGRVKPRVDRNVASQLDLVPTMLALAGGNTHYAAMGRDLTRPAPANPFAFFAGGSNTNVIGWLEGDLLLSKWLARPVPVLLTAREPAVLKDLFPTRKAEADRLLLKTQHFHQFARSLERENRIWPPREHKIFRRK